MSGDPSEAEFIDFDTGDEFENHEVCPSGAQTPWSDYDALEAQDRLRLELHKRWEGLSDGSDSTTDNTSSPMSQTTNQWFGHDGSPTAFPFLPVIVACSAWAQYAPAAPAGNTPSAFQHQLFGHHVGSVAFPSLPPEDRAIVEGIQFLARHPELSNDPTVAINLARAAAKLAPALAAVSDEIAITHARAAPASNTPSALQLTAWKPISEDKLDQQIIMRLFDILGKQWLESNKEAERSKSLAQTVDFFATLWFHGAAGPEPTFLSDLREHMPSTGIRVSPYPGLGGDEMILCELKGLPVIHYFEGFDLEAYPAFQAGAVMKDQFVALKNPADGSCLFFKSLGFESFAPIIQEAESSFGAGEAKLIKLRAGGPVKIRSEGSKIKREVEICWGGDGEGMTCDRIKSKATGNSSNAGTCVLLWSGLAEARNNLYEQRRNAIEISRLYPDIDEVDPAANLGADLNKVVQRVTENTAPSSSAAEAGSEVFFPTTSSASNASSPTRRRCRSLI